MSTQSGITSSPELIESFKNYISNHDRCLIITIDSTENLIPYKLIKGTSSMVDDFRLIQDELNEIDCKFLIIKNDELDSKNIFISYVPDNSKIKQKMMFASTKNTLLKELGGIEIFKPILFINEINEISEDGWNAIKKHENSENPLSPEEESLQTVKRLELLNIGRLSNKQQLASIHDNSSSTSGTTSSNQLGSNLDTQVISSLSKLNDNELIILTINETEQIQQFNDLVKFNDVNELANGAMLLNTQPSYSILKTNNYLYFIYSCPSGSKVRDRMVYASSKLGFLNKLKEKFEFKKIIEVGDFDELELSEFNNDQQQQQQPTTASSGLKFSKPKGPRRR